MIALPERVEVTIEKEIDARGSFSPGPLIERIREVRRMPVGSVLAVLSSDPGSVHVIGGSTDNYVQRTEESAPSSPHISGYTPN
jgi:TusA-related sulfurtransferase